MGWRETRSPGGTPRYRLGADKSTKAESRGTSVAVILLWASLRCTGTGGWICVRRCGEWIKDAPLPRNHTRHFRTFMTKHLGRQIHPWSATRAGLYWTPVGCARNPRAAPTFCGLSAEGCRTAVVLQPGWTPMEVGGHRRGRDLHRWTSVDVRGRCAEGYGSEGSATGEAPRRPAWGPWPEASG